MRGSVKRLESDKVLSSRLTRSAKSRKIPYMKYLKVHTLDRGQWYDRDTILLHAAFRCWLISWNRNGPGRSSTGSKTNCIATRGANSRSFCFGGKKNRPQRRDPLNDVASPPEEAYRLLADGPMIFPDRAKYPEYYAAMDKSAVLENEWFEEDQRQLHRLIDVRPFLWT